VACAQVKAGDAATGWQSTFSPFAQLRLYTHKVILLQILKFSKHVHPSLCCFQFSQLFRRDVVLSSDSKRKRQIRPTAASKPLQIPFPTAL
jgi:hypothetical protein